MERDELFNLLEYKNILQHTTDMIQVISGHGDFLYVNESWKTSLGYQDHTLSTINFDDILVIKSNEDAILLNKIKNGITINNVNLTLKSISGDHVPVQGNIIGMTNVENPSIKTICILKDRREIINKNDMEEKLMKIIHADNEFRSVNLEGIDYEGISNLMLYLSRAEHVTFNLYDQITGEVQTVASAGNRDFLEFAEKILGFGTVGKKLAKNQEKMNLLQDKAVYVIKDLLTITKDGLEEAKAKAMQKELGIGEIVIVNIIKEGVSLGNFTLVMKENNEFVAHEIIECFATQIGLVMAKHDAVKKLIKIKEKFIHTIEATGIATWESDLTNNKVTYSSKWAEMLGYSSEELQSGSIRWEDLWHPDDKEMIEKNIEEYLSRKTEKYEIIHRLRTKSNEYKWILARGSVLKDVEKNSLYFVGIHIDVTHIHNEEAKRISENIKLNNILDATNVGSWEWNILTDEIVYNERWAEILGYTLDEISPITKETFKKFTYPGEFEKSEAEVKELFEKKKEYYSLECKMKHKNGEPVWVLDSGKVISWTPEGKPAVMFGSHIDITEIKNLEMGIKESEDKYRILVESSYDIIYHIDMDGNFTFVSKAWTEQLGHSHDVIGKPFRTFVHPEDIQVIWNFFGSVNKSNERMQTTDYRILHKDGTWHWFNTNVTALWNNEGKNIGFAGTARDVTEMKIATKKLREQKDELEHFFTVNLDFFCILDLEGNFMKINLPWEKDLGYAQSDLLGNPIIDWIHEDDYDQTIQAFEIMVSNKAEANITNRFKRTDGTYRILEWKAKYTNGMVYAAARDVTENKRLEESLHLEKELFRTTLLSVGDGVIATNNKGRITIMNEAAQKMTGWTQEEAFGKDLYDVYVLYREKTKVPVHNHIQEVILKGQMKKYEDIILMSKTNIEIPVEDRSSPIKDSAGKITGAVIAFRDITDKKEKQKRNDFMIYHDALTGLYNRRYLDEAALKIERNRHLPLTIMVIDVNGLKLTNDAFGHHKGDELLQKVAEVLIEVSRKDDVVARVGGDEFTILLPRTSISEADEIKKKINQIAKDKENHPIMISLGIGYAAKTYKTQNLKEVQKVADNNMYRDKLKYGKIMKRKMVNEILRNLNEEFEPERHHLQNVEVYCGKMAHALGFSEAETKRVMSAGRLHDIGKIAVPKTILEKPGKLTLEEYEIIKRHTEVSYQILKSVDEYAIIAEDVLYHHERIDGKGYPEGIKGQDIPLNSKIIAVVDSYDAMVGNRTYQKRKTKFEAIEELRRCSGTQFDPYIVDVFINKILLSKNFIDPDTALAESDI